MKSLDLQGHKKREREKIKNSCSDKYRYHAKIMMGRGTFLSSCEGRKSEGSRQVVPSEGGIDVIILVGICSLFRKKKKKRVDIPGFLSMARGSSLNILLLLYFSINDVCCVLSCFDVEKRLRSVCRWFSVSSPSPPPFFASN